MRHLFAVRTGDWGRELEAPHNSQSTGSLAEVNGCCSDEKEGSFTLLFLSVLFHLFHPVRLERFRFEDFVVEPRVGGHLDVVGGVVGSLTNEQPTVVAKQRHNDNTQDEDDREHGPHRDEEAAIDRAETPRCCFSGHGVVVGGDEKIQHRLAQFLHLEPDRVFPLGHLKMIQPFVDVVEVVLDIFDPRLQVEKSPTAGD